MADINKAVMVTFGAVGQEKLASSLTATVGKITAVTAAVGFAVAAFAKMVSAADEFGDILQSNTTDMSVFSQKTTGLINTMEALRGAVKAQEAGLNLSANSIAAIGVAAENMAIKLGEGEQGATRRFNELIDAVIGGRERALIPYGITLDETTDKHAAQAEAVKKLVEKYGDLDVSITGADDKMASLNNTMSTVRDAVISEVWNDFANSWVDIAANIFGGADAMRQFEQEILATNGTILQWEYSIDGLTNRLLRNIDSIIRYGSLLGGPIGAIIGYYASKSDAVQGLVDEALKERQSQVGYRTKRAQEEASSLNYERELANFPMEYGDTRTARSGGGGGRGRGQRSDMEFSLDEVEAIEAAMYSPRLAEYSAPTETDLQYGQSFGEMSGGASSLSATLGTGSGAGAMAAREAASASGRAASFEQQMRLESERQLAMQDSQRNGLAVMLGLEKDAMEERRKLYEKDAGYRVSSSLAAVGAVSDIFSNLSNTVDASTEKGFKAQKAMAISAGVVNTTLASIAAFRSVIETVPFPASMVLAPIMAASVMASGMAAVAQIAKTQYGGGAQSASAPSFSAGGMGASASTSQGGQTIVNNIVIDGQVIHSSLLNANRRASQSGSPAFAMR